MRLVGRTAMVGALALLGALGGAGAAAAAGPSSSRPAPSAHGPCKDTGLRPTPKDIARIAAATLCLIDRERAIYSLVALRTNSSLQRIASRQAKAMVVGDYFGDDTPSGTTPWQRITASAYGIGAHSVAAAQNIGWGTKQMATPAGMVSIWMHSAPHRQIVLTGGYRDIGIGVAPNAPTSLTRGAPGATYTVEFAVRG
ncbi:MAG: CAP domain-containing protein [Solirubrobacteraceae bacterium]